MVFDVTNDVANGLELLSFLIGNVDAEFFLKRHDELDGVEGVGTEVFDEFGSMSAPKETGLIPDLFRIW